MKLKMILIIVMEKVVLKVYLRKHQMGHIDLKMRNMVKDLLVKILKLIPIKYIHY